LSVFGEEEVEFLVIGAHAVMFHSQPRYTKDLDIWVRPTVENAARVYRALCKFGAPLQGVSPEDFASETSVYQMGVEPDRIDIVMSIDGVGFDEAWPGRQKSSFAGVPYHLIGLDALIKNKQASGRPRDLLDVESLLKAKRRRP
jgi:hypothetical protein